LTKRN